MPIGSRLREARLANGLTTAELASRVGVTGSHISQIERGVVDPSFGALNRICAALGLRMAALFVEDNLPASFGASSGDPGRWVGIVRAHERHTLVPPRSHVQHELLCPDLQHNLEAFRTIIPAGRLAFIGQDLVQSGCVAAEYLVDVLHGAGDVIITTRDAGGQWSIEREMGARRAFARHPAIRVRSTVDGAGDEEVARMRVESALSAAETLAGVCALDSGTTQFAGEVIRRQDLKGRLHMVGFDEAPASVEMIRDGYIAAVFTQAPERQSYEAVHTLVDLLHGRPICSLDIGIGRIDASNVDAYLAGMPLNIEERRGTPIDPRDFVLDARIARRVAAGETLFIPVSYVALSQPLVPFLRRGVEKAARDFQVNAVLVGPSAMRVEAQIAELEDLVRHGVDGLAVCSSGTDALAPVIDRFIEQGIPVVTYNSDNPESGRLAFAGLQSPETGADIRSRPSAHTGEEWALVVRGSLEFVIEARSFVLNAGDTVYFDSSQRHHWKNIGLVPAEIIWVASPPHF